MQPNDGAFVETSQPDLSSFVILQKDINPFMSLISQLSMIPGLTRRGNQLVVRGAALPLYALDGMPVKCFEQIKHMIWLADIGKITYLKGPAAAVYGTRAQMNGIIMIETAELPN